MQEFGRPARDDKGGGTRKLNAIGFDGGMTQGTHTGRIDGHTINRVRRGGEASKPVNHRIVTIAIAVAAVAVVTSRRITIILLAGTRAEDTAYDGTDDYKDCDGNTNPEPVVFLPFGGARGDIAGGFVIIWVSGAVWRSGSGMACGVVVVIRRVVGHVSSKSFRVFAWKGTGTASES